MRHMTIGAALVTAALLVAGCQSWHGEAEVRLKDGTRLRCDRGLTFQNHRVGCEGSGISVPWDAVAGYSTR